MTLTHATFDIPADDTADFARLPAKVRDNVRWLLRVMSVISAAGKKVAACQIVAEQSGKHFNTIYKPWISYRESGDWRVLIDKRYTSEFWKRDDSRRVALPADFVTHWKTLVEDNDRAAKPAHLHLARKWRKWLAGDLTCRIPGYDRCPPPAGPGKLPLGWTYSNLLQYMPSDIELAAVRKGRFAAQEMLPSIITTRAGSYPFAEIQFDDMWHNFMVNVEGRTNACRLLEFGAVDMFSTFIFKPGLKPRLRNMDTGRMEILNNRDWHIFLVNWLMDFGAHPDGTILNVENGTAAISRAFEEKLLMWFGGRITVKRAAMSGRPAFPGAWRERAKGNFHAKALKEGMGNLLQNALGHIPGQVGMHRNDTPAGLDGRERENELLLCISAAVPALREKLQLGFLDLKDAVFAVNETYELLNFRTDHNNEGWEESGLVIDEFRANAEIGGWIALTDAMGKLSEADRNMLRIQLQLDPTLRRRRKLSPAECVLAHRTHLIKPPHEAIPDLLGPEFGQTHDVANGLITFKSPEHGKLRYKATYQDRDGFLRRVPNGEEVLAHFNPWKPSHLYLSDPKTGRFLGRAERDMDIRRADQDAMQHAIGRREAEYKHEMREAAQRHGIKRIATLEKNTAALREANRPTIRDRALSTGDFDASVMLGEDMASVPADASTAFDPADLL